MASSSTSSIHNSFKYDVFISFRGEDTRKNFVDHLYHALQEKNIHTYKDDEGINKGKRISEELMGSIEDSKFFIIVFSKNYASSSWCLSELVKIMECQKTTEHTVYPVFYDVEPSEVRNQIGAVGEAFAILEKEEAVGKWRKALREAADLAGWELKNTVDGHEAKFIRQIVEKLSLELRAINVRIDKNLVGMETRINDLLSLLGSASDDVHMIGIWGIGGGGKTTLARAVFNNISFQFEGKSFIENVREVSKASLSGLNSLKSQVPLNGGKVLIVLDDVDHLNQLEALAGDRSWFKPGSIIIITTRDEQVLVAHKVKLIHNVNLLSKGEASCLFCRYAFGREIPVQGYEELSGQVVRYAAGLPLTLKVLGSSLCGRIKPEWVDALARLKKIPEEEIQKKLELSYISLDNEQKEIFLDVATVLKGWRKDDAIKALESCGFYAIIGLRVLEQKSLITIDVYKGVGMHDQLEEMGKNIVRRAMPNKRCRLWNSMEIEDILATNQCTESTRCIKFRYEGQNPEIIIEGVRKMKELRFLHVTTESNHLNREIDKLIPYFPDALRYLSWTNYPFRSLPKGTNLVRVHLVCSNMVQLWEGGERKVLNKLRFLYLHGEKLRFVDLRLTPNLETLDISGGGDGGVELYMPIECPKLRSIDLSFIKLRRLDIGLTPNLEELHLWVSSDVQELHMGGGCVKLRYLQLFDSKVRTIDLGPSPNLERLDLHFCNDLEEFHIAECPKLTKIKSNGSKLRTLDLRLARNLSSLPLSNCQELESLTVSHSKLRSLDLGLTPNIKELDLEECENLLEIHAPVGCLKNLVYLDLSGCLVFTSFLFHLMDNTSGIVNESLEDRPFAELSFTLKRCPIHPETNSPNFQSTYLHGEDLPSLRRSIEKLISEGPCACTKLKIFHKEHVPAPHLSPTLVEDQPDQLTTAEPSEPKSWKVYRRRNKK